MNQNPKSEARNPKQIQMTKNTKCAKRTRFGSAKQLGADPSYGEPGVLNFLHF
jgi:hypothetical protein